MQQTMRAGRGGHWGCVIAAVGLVLACGAGSTAGAATDKEITDKVKNAIAADPVLGRRGITVSSYKGRVLLQGEVLHEREADRAVGLANSIEEVRSVQNNLVGYLPHVTDTTVRDKEITDQVKAALASDPTLRERDIKVTTYKRRVQLLGTVPTQREADRAVELAKNVEEVQSVQNDLLGYLPPLAFSTAGDKAATEKVRNALAADSVLSQRKITVNTLEGRVLLTGNVEAQREAEKAVELAKNVEEVRSVQDDLTGYLSP